MFHELKVKTTRNNKNPIRLGMLVSGNGSNLQALIDFGKTQQANYQIAVVISNKTNAYAVERARKNNIPVFTIEHQNFASKILFEDKIIATLKQFDIDLVVLAGFMRILTAHFLNKLPNRIINIHPALCPAFPGAHAIKQALDKKVWFTGCTVHLVNEGVDEGPIIAQAIVPILSTDDETSLTLKVQAQEHLLLPSILNEIAKNSQTIGHIIDVERKNHL
ncbi:MAG: phosphoribosylglycinamide formyltransferase [bacterium]|nr:phosphoribosylglycinamide formyltransferase [bacterium]